MMVRGQHGFAMAALLIALSVMAVTMTVALPVWKQAAQREKEAELIFRGQQYARAIGLFQRKAGPGALPPNLDVLVQQRFLRSKYKDPITGKDFNLVSPAQSAAGAAQPGTAGRGQTAAPATTVTNSRLGQGSVITAGAPLGGIVGVASKSKDKSIRIYNGRTHYNEWVFQF